MKYMNILIVPLLFFSFSCFSIASSYETKSQYSKSYKCVVDEAGGYNHNINSHDLSRFRNTRIFYLTHITHIPRKPMIDMVKYKEALDASKTLKSINPTRSSESIAREVYEKLRLHRSKGKLGDGLYAEDGAYYISTEEQNPLERMAYTNACSAISYSASSGSIITCYSNRSSGSTDTTFKFNTKNGRFVYSYLGSWQDESESNDYQGDSSIFMFGRCKEHYR